MINYLLLARVCGRSIEEEVGGGWLGVTGGAYREYMISFGVY